MHPIRFILVGLLATAALGCPQSGPAKPLHRERAQTRDASCTDAKRPSAYFYPAENRNDYKPDHPDRDGCRVLVPDHLFCCPHAPRPTDR